jgi:hypothetical protein
MKAIAIVLIAAMVLAPATALFATATAASPGVNASFRVDNDYLRSNISTVLTVTVTNTGDTNIENVMFKLSSANPGTITDLGCVVMVPKENMITLGPENENVVILKKGTKIQLDSSVSVKITENTEVIIPDGADVYRTRGTDYKGPAELKDNLRVKITNDEYDYTTNTVTGSLDNLSFALSTDNCVSPLADVIITVDNGDALLLADTLAIPTSTSGVYKVVSETPVMLLAKASAMLGAENILKMENSHLLTLTDSDNTAGPGDTRGRRFVALEAKDTYAFGIAPGDNILLDVRDARLRIPAGTPVILVGNSSIYLAVDNVVYRGARENITTTAAPDEIKKKPANWTPSSGTNYVKWDNSPGLKPGESLEFPFALTLPENGGVYYFDVYLNGILLGNGNNFSITVDNKAPTITISASPAWVKDNVDVTITVKGDEPFTFDNVFVMEKNGENVRVEMSSTDNITWTGTYRTGDNKERDGYATIFVVGVRDRVGNSPDTVPTATDKLWIDRRAPGKLNMGAWEGFPAQIDNRSSFLIRGSLTVDLDNLAPGYPSALWENILNGMEIEFCVDNQWLTSRADVKKDGTFAYELSLTEGKHSIGARLIDWAGNVGEDNFENVIIDITAPSVDIQVKMKTSGNLVSKGGYAKENKLVITVSFSDGVLGIENLMPSWELAENFRDNENWDSGYVVCFLVDNNGTWITPTGMENVLRPRVYPKLENKDNVVSGVFLTYTFENETIELPEGKYLVRVFAGDSMSKYGKGAHRTEENFVFTVDITAPSPPPAASLVGSITAGTLASPTGTKTKTFTLRGTAEANATIKVYVTTDGGVTWTEVTAARTTAGTDGSWMTQLDLSAYAGQTLGIAVTATDAAGNESDRTLYGYLIYDASAPTVSITSPKTGTKTSKASIEVTGTVTKDPWEDWSDITLRIQVGTGAVTVPVSGIGNTVTFSYSVALSEGTNTILVYVSDGMNSSSASVTVTRTVTPWGTYAVVLVIIALIIAAIAILRVRK